MKYAKIFAVGVAVGVSVSLGMAAFDVVGLLGGEAFLGTALANPIYSGAFFGVIQVSAAIGSEVISPFLERVTEAKHTPVERASAQSEEITHARESQKQHSQSNAYTQVTDRAYQGRMAPTLERQLG